MKLLFDEMLKKLARWFRILGVDSAYVEHLKDEEIIKKAQKEGRLVITRDEELAKKSGGILLEKIKTEEQIAEVIKKSGIKIEFPEKSRCTLCNGELKEIANKEWTCKKCGQKYWIGSHWKNINVMLRKIKELINS